MSETPSPNKSRTTDRILQGIAARDRRRCLSLLDGHSELPVELLGRGLAGDGRKQVDDPPTVSVDSQHLRLVHVNLPKLADVGLVDWNRAEGTVRLTDHPALTDETFWELVETDGPDWDDVLAALSRTRRRRTLSVLAEASGESLTRGELTRRLLARVTDETSSTVPERKVQRVTVQMHHRHLPKLEDADLIEYDGTTVGYTGHAALEEEWLTAQLWEPARSPISQTD